MSDLVVLVADKDMEVVMQTLLEKRQKSLKISNLSFKILVHQYGDSGREAI